MYFQTLIRVIRVAFLLFCLMGHSHAVSTPVTILFAGNGTTPAAGEDGAVMAYLQGRYGATNVTYMQVGSVNAAIAEGYDGLILSSTSLASDIRNKFHNSSVGILNWNEAVMDSETGEFGMSDVVMTKSITTTRMGLAPHPITAGLPPEILFATSGETLSTFGIHSGSTALGTAVDGTRSDGNGAGSVAGNPMLFVTEVGDAVNPGAGITGNVAPGRRVMFPMSDNTFTALSSAGRELFGRAVDWSAGVERPLIRHHVLGSSGGRVSNGSVQLTSTVGQGGPPGYIENGNHLLHSGFLNSFILQPQRDTDADGRIDEYDPDDDADGLGDLVELAGSGFDPLTVTDPLINDSDADGVADGSEAVAGTNPLDANSLLTIIQADRTGAGAVIEWRSRQGKTYEVWYGSSIQEVNTNPQLLEIVTVTGGGQGAFLETTTTSTNAAPSASNIYRIEVQP